MRMETMHTPKQVAEYLQISATTMYRLLDSREIEYVIVGKSKRIRHSVLMAYLEDHTVAPRTLVGVR